MIVLGWPVNNSVVQNGNGGVACRTTGLYIITRIRTYTSALCAYRSSFVRKLARMRGRVLGARDAVCSKQFV